MLVQDRLTFHLTYCSNIHPGESWDEVKRNLETHLPAVRARLDAGGPFGIGLRLSARAAAALAVERELAAFRAFLRDHGYYVFTINGFPHGTFHGRRVKEEVYRPDWLDEERLRYTNQLATILAALLPDDLSIEGSVSSVPGAFKASVRSPHDVQRMAGLMLRHAAHLADIRRATGRTIALALEPEPCCFIETVDEAIAFFADYLFDPGAIARAARAGDVSITPDEARRHLGLCLDACHMAVEFEDMAGVLARLRASGVPIRKVQLSSALQLRFREGDGQAAETFARFADPVYFHQVVERTSGGVVRYVDLPDALAVESRRSSGRPIEWRVHYHVPVCLERMGSFETTQQELAALLDLLRQDGPCPYLEVETYTWDVLPPEYRTADVATAIARELDWVRERLRR
jgi:sugar phosphate isomerase/epimerase